LINVFFKALQALGGHSSSNFESSLTVDELQSREIDLQFITEAALETVYGIVNTNFKSYARIQEDKLVVPNYLHRVTKDKRSSIRWVPIYRIAMRQFEFDKPYSHWAQLQKFDFNLNDQNSRVLNFLTAAWYMRMMNFAYKRHYLRYDPKATHFNSNDFWEQEIFEVIKRDVEHELLRENSLQEIRVYLDSLKELRKKAKNGEIDKQRLNDIPKTPFALGLHDRFKKRFAKMRYVMETSSSNNIMILNNSVDLNKLCEIYKDKFVFEVFYFSNVFLESNPDYWIRLYENFLGYLKVKKFQCVSFIIISQLLQFSKTFFLIHLI
jgi:hypothetical protein